MYIGSKLIAMDRSSGIHTFSGQQTFCYLAKAQLGGPREVQYTQNLCALSAIQWPDFMLSSKSRDNLLYTPFERDS
jgi:hypothetical protein